MKQNSVPAFEEKTDLLLLSQVLGLFNQQELLRGQTRNSGRAFLGLMLHEGGEIRTSRCPCSLPGGVGPLSGVEVGVGPGVGPEVWLGWPAHPVGGAVCGVPAPKKWQLAVWSLCILLFMICPSCACTRLLQLLLVPVVSLSSVAQRKCLSRCKQCSQRSQARPVSLLGDEIGGVLSTHIMRDLGSGVILSRLGVTLKSLWPKVVFPNYLQLFSKCEKAFH